MSVTESEGATAAFAAYYRLSRYAAAAKLNTQTPELREQWCAVARAVIAAETESQRATAARFGALVLTP